MSFVQAMLCSAGYFIILSSRRLGVRLMRVGRRAGAPLLGIADIARSWIVLGP